MTIDEINAQIAEKAEQIEELKKICDEQKKIKEAKFKEVTDFMMELSTYQKEYYDFRTLLAFGDLTDEQFNYYESIMPIYEVKIAQLKEQLSSMKPQDFL